MKNNVIKVELNVVNNKVNVMRVRNIDYISLTDLARYTNPDEPILVPIDNCLLNRILFENYGYTGKFFSTSLSEILTKINYANVDFRNFKADGFDFSPYTGIKIKPQQVYNQNLNNATCSGVEFIGSFDEVYIEGANFKGSRGAKINPQTIGKDSLENTICTDVEFIGYGNDEPDFSGIKINGADFTGSNYEETIKFENEFREKIKLMTNGNVHVK